MDSPQFANKDQEIVYWKKLANQYLKEKTDAQQELDDFTEESGQLERELEASLEQSERVIRDLRSTNRNLQTELEASRNKLENAQKDWYSLESNYNALASEKEKLVIYIRELEQKNDDLERAHRVVTESVASFEDLLNKAYEKNAMLENEVGEKDNLQVQLQRLRDEARDLKQELNVKIVDSDKSLSNGHNNSYQNLSMDSNRLHCEMETQTTVQSPLNNTPIKQPILNGNTLTPAGRISAMNIVGDLLRKVGFGKLLCPACSRVSCTCKLPNSEVGSHENAENSANSPARLIEPMNNIGPKTTIDQELNSMEFNLIKNTINESENISSRSRSGTLSYTNSFSQIFNRKLELPETVQNGGVTNRFQIWLNNLVNKTNSDESN